MKVFSVSLKGERGSADCGSEFPVLGVFSSLVIGQKGNKI